MFDIAHDPWPDIDQVIDAKRAITRLDGESQFILGYWLAGYTQAEIAALMGLSRPAITRRIRLILRALRVSLQ